MFATLSRFRRQIAVLAVLAMSEWTPAGPHAICSIPSALSAG